MIHLVYWGVIVWLFLWLMWVRSDLKLYKSEYETYRGWYYESSQRLNDLHERFIDLSTSTILRTNRQLRNARAKIAQLMKDKAAK